MHCTVVEYTTAIDARMPNVVNCTSEFKRVALHWLGRSVTTTRVLRYWRIAGGSSNHHFPKQIRVSIETISDNGKKMRFRQFFATFSAHYGYLCQAQYKNTTIFIRRINSNDDHVKQLCFNTITSLSTTTNHIITQQSSHFPYTIP